MALINAKIDVTKLTKSKLYKGEKGTYANIVIADLKGGEDDYGNTHTIYEAQSKEEREAGTDRVYLGSGKMFTFNGNGSAKSESTPEPVGIDDDIPF